MAEIVAVVVVAVVVAAEIAGNKPIKTCRALERGIWEQIPRFFFITWVTRLKQGRMNYLSSHLPERGD